MGTFISVFPWVLMYVVAHRIMPECIASHHPNYHLSFCQLAQRNRQYWIWKKASATRAFSSLKVMRRNVKVRKRRRDPLSWKTALGFDLAQWPGLRRRASTSLATATKALVQRTLYHMTFTVLRMRLGSLQTGLRSKPRSISPERQRDGLHVSSMASCSILLVQLAVQNCI